MNPSPAAFYQRPLLDLVILVFFGGETMEGRWPLGERQKIVSQIPEKKISKYDIPKRWQKCTKSSMR